MENTKACLKPSISKLVLKICVVYFCCTVFFVYLAPLKKRTNNQEYIDKSFPSALSLAIVTTGCRFLTVTECYTCVHGASFSRISLMCAIVLFSPWRHSEGAYFMIMAIVLLQIFSLFDGDFVGIAGSTPLLLWSLSSIPGVSKYLSNYLGVICNPGENPESELEDSSASCIVEFECGSSELDGILDDIP